MNDPACKLQIDFENLIVKVLSLGSSLVRPKLRSIIFVGDNNACELETTEGAITSQVIAEARQTIQEVSAVSEYQFRTPRTDWVEIDRIDARFYCKG